MAIDQKNIRRRSCRSFSLGYGLRAAHSSALRIGVTDWNLNLGVDPGAVSKAAALGFQGVQVSFGRHIVGGKMPADHREIIAKYLELSKQTGIMDMSRSRNVLVYYDVGNSTQAGFDVAKEIRWLGKDRICQFHFKDNPHFLGTGSIHFDSLVQAIRDIGWLGWANLETDTRPGYLDSDMRRNLTYVRGVINQVYG